MLRTPPVLPPGFSGARLASSRAAVVHVTVPAKLPPDLEPYRPILGAIGQFRDARLVKRLGDDFPTGTAFHIGGGLVLTAGHVASKPLGARGRPMTITWARIDGGAPVESQVTQVVAHKLKFNFIDYALLRVEPIPDAQIELDFSPAIEGRTVALIGHPDNRTLESRATPAPVRKVEADGMSFYHQVKTEHGNSGGPVIDTRTLKALGIVSGGAGQATALFAPELKALLDRLAPEWRGS